MTTWGYNAFLIRLNTPHRTRELHRLSAFGGNKDQDLLGNVDSAAASVLEQWCPMPNSSEGFRLRTARLKARTLFLQANRGIHGVQGESYNIDTGESTDHDEKVALLSGLRAMLAVPEGSYYGLLFAERIAGRHLKEIIKRHFLVPAIASHDVVIHVEPFAQHKDWQLLLSGKEALEVREYLQVRDSGQDGSTPPSTVKVVVDGPRVQGVTAAIKDTILGRSSTREDWLDDLARAAGLREEQILAEASGSGFTIEKEEELAKTVRQIEEYRKRKDAQDPIHQTLDAVVPVAVGEDKEVIKRRYDVAMGEERAERVFSVERDTLPVFTYELGQHLSDDGLKATWVAHAEEIFAARGIDTPDGWA